MQKQPPIAAVHHGDAEAHKARRAIAQFMGDPVPFRNSVGAEQRCSNLTACGAVETAIKGAKGEHQPAYPGRRQRRWIRARIAAVERPPQSEGGSHSDFKEPVKRQQNRRRICTAAVQMHAHPGAETLDDIVVTFSDQYGIKR
jgi:hypothetical protein